MVRWQSTPSCPDAAARLISLIARVELAVASVTKTRIDDTNFRQRVVNGGQEHFYLWVVGKQIL